MSYPPKAVHRAASASRGGDFDAVETQEHVQNKLFVSRGWSWTGHEEYAEKRKRVFKEKQEEHRKLPLSFAYPFNCFPLCPLHDLFTTSHGGGFLIRPYSSSRWFEPAKRQAETATRSGKKAVNREWRMVNSEKHSS